MFDQQPLPAIHPWATDHVYRTYIVHITPLYVLYQCCYRRAEDMCLRKDGPFATWYTHREWKGPIYCDIRPCWYYPLLLPHSVKQHLDLSQSSPNRRNLSYCTTAVTTGHPVPSVAAELHRPLSILEPFQQLQLHVQHSQHQNY